MPYKPRDRKPDEDERDPKDDTIAASLVRDVFGDKAANDFRKFFGDFF